MAKELGQYFTTNTELRLFVQRHIKNTAGTVLEPSFGRGDLINVIINSNPWRTIVGVELDARLRNSCVISNINQGVHDLRWGADFLTQEFHGRKFKTIVANPPYYKVKGEPNLYLKFIEKCFDLLDVAGIDAGPPEMIFIVPSDFLQLTSAAPLLERMITQGAFTDIWYPENEHLFPGASIDVMAFRYERNETCPYPYTTRLVRGSKMIPTCFAMENGRLIRVSDNTRPIWRDFNVFVGMVTGKDEVFKVPFGNMPVLTGKDTVTNFIFADKFPTENNQINEHLQQNKEALMSRKIVKQTEANWFKWGAPRCIGYVNQNKGQDCIYVKTLTRDKEVAFLGKVQYFSGNLLCMVPIMRPNKINLKEVVDFLNSDEFQREYIFSGRFKIGCSLLSNVKYPHQQRPSATL